MIHRVNMRLTWEKKSVRHSVGACRVDPLPLQARPRTRPLSAVVGDAFIVCTRVCRGVRRGRSAASAEPPARLSLSPQLVAQLLFPQTSGDIALGFSAVMGPRSCSHRRVFGLSFRISFMWSERQGCGSSAGRVSSTESTGATASSTWPCCCGPDAWVDWLTFPVRSDVQITLEIWYLHYIKINFGCYRIARTLLSISRLICLFIQANI